MFAPPYLFGHIFFLDEQEGKLSCRKVVQKTVLKCMQEAEREHRPEAQSLLAFLHLQMRGLVFFSLFF